MKYLRKKQPNESLIHKSLQTGKSLNIQQHVCPNTALFTAAWRGESDLFLEKEPWFKLSDGYSQSFVPTYMHCDQISVILLSDNLQ